MTDEELYRSYLDGDETGLAALMDQYGNALTLYIDGYLGDIHEAEDLMIEVFSYLLVKRPHIRDGGRKPISIKPPVTWRCATSAESLLYSAWKIWQRSRKPGRWSKKS